MVSQKVTGYCFLSEPQAVIPAKVGTQCFQSVADHLDSGFRRRLHHSIHSAAHSLRSRMHPLFFFGFFCNHGLGGQH